MLAGMATGKLKEINNINDIKIDIVWKTNGAGGLQEWALIVGGITAIAAVLIALFQYISTNRAQERAHMHSIFREYLTVRMNAPRGKAAAVIGYRYYAMEEVFYWLKRERSCWKLLLRMRDDEHKSWLNTIDHHVHAEEGSNAYKYFDRNQLLFGLEYRKHVCGLLKLTVKDEKAAAASTPVDEATAKQSTAAAAPDAPPPPPPQAPGPS